MRGTFLGVFLGQKNCFCGEQNARMQEQLILPLLTMNQSKEGALGEAVCQEQGLTKPKKGFSGLQGCRLGEISMTK